MVKAGSVLAVALALMSAASVGPHAPTAYVAHLWGREQVPTVVTKAWGVATFEVAGDGASIRYRLEVSRLVNVQMAHIHVAPPGQNGPVVVWLYPAAPPPQLRPGRLDGELASGVITVAQLAGPLSRQPLSALLERMRVGEAYVNVHTVAHPAGEIRGQILPR
ncbi:MAG: CHRD domain protein [candidate division GAL15 bacterium]